MGDQINMPRTDSEESKLNPKIDAKWRTAFINAQIRQKELDNTEKKEERGWLGKFFGGKNSSSNNIAGAFILTLLVIGFIYTLVMLIYCPTSTHQQVLDFWGIITPLITVALGYIFGNKQNTP